MLDALDAREDPAPAPAACARVLEAYRTSSATPAHVGLLLQRVGTAEAYATALEIFEKSVANDDAEAGAGAMLITDPAAAFVVFRTLDSVSLSHRQRGALVALGESGDVRAIDILCHLASITPWTRYAASILARHPHFSVSGIADFANNAERRIATLGVELVHAFICCSPSREAEIDAARDALAPAVQHALERDDYTAEGTAADAARKWLAKSAETA